MAALVLLASSGAVVAETLRADDAITLRRGAFALQGHYFSQLKPMVTGKAAFDAERAMHLIERVDDLLQMTAELFPEGSDQGDTQAHADIWRNRARFNDLQQASADSLKTLANAAGGNDDAALRRAYLEAAGACKQCHDDYRRR